MTASNFTNILNRLFPWRRARLNRKFKDHLFRFLFREKSELLSLYNAVNGTDYTDPDALTIMTLEDVIYLGMKNDVSFLIDGRLSLYEYQSSICPNMPLRGLFYFSQMLQGYVDQNNLNIYSKGITMNESPRAASCLRTPASLPAFANRAAQKSWGGDGYDSDRLQ